MITVIKTLLITLFKDLINFIKLKLLTSKLNSQKQKTIKEVKNAEEAYNNFMREYNKYLDESKSVRESSDPVRDSSGDSEEGN